jgi:hypothetical protein
VDSFTHALGVLDPANRALLDLSLRRGMRPEEIGDLLGSDPESVIVAREQALEQLAWELGMDDVSEINHVRARLVELPADAWTPPLVEQPVAEPELPAARRDDPAPSLSRKRRLPLLLALLAAVAVALVIVLAPSGSDNKTASSAPATPAGGNVQPGAKPASTVTGRRVALAGVAGAPGATGTAALADGGKRLRLDVRGLPPATYEVWLYNSVIDARSLVTARGTALTLDLALPRNTRRYRYVDISLEPNDGNPNHSGRSVLRVPLTQLAR